MNNSSRRKNTRGSVVLVVNESEQDADCGLTTAVRRVRTGFESPPEETRSVSVEREEERRWRERRGENPSSRVVVVVRVVMAIVVV